jgi:DNA-binding NarL/FixJ family response regulator
LRLLRAAKTAKVIGNELGISDKTVYIHRASLMEKFKCKTLIELSQKAHELGI